MSMAGLLPSLSRAPLHQRIWAGTERGKVRVQGAFPHGLCSFLKLRLLLVPRTPRA